MFRWTPEIQYSNLMGLGGISGTQIDHSSNKHAHDVGYQESRSKLSQPIFCENLKL